jgi:hypothetical protein
MRQSLKACRIRGQTDDVAKNEVTLQWAGGMTVAGYATKNPIDRARTANHTKWSSKATMNSNKSYRARGTELHGNQIRLSA